MPEEQWEEEDYGAEDKSRMELDSQQTIRPTTSGRLPPQLADSESRDPSNWSILKPSQLLPRSLLDVLLGAIIAKPSEPLESYISLGDYSGSLKSVKTVSRDVVWSRESAKDYSVFLSSAQTAKCEVTTIKELTT